MSDESEQLATLLRALAKLELPNDVFGSASESAQWLIDHGVTIAWHRLRPVSDAGTNADSKNAP